ncbi:uncharacterized protein BXZ73DRAFT_102343 [Epithele typhae]|uniref:uncharacterized protein n=1 Tax=Epithele typhae TaxID=378194 RepID=UPI00200745C7|nr:uncharacterized protein BXZ73DRAFT_102343 [Epithele typhae]KAH9928503.1 hypothetical protein BXZ73DRAFT_102343 [Epithele typhae]
MHALPEALCLASSMEASSLRWPIDAEVLFDRDPSQWRDVPDIDRTLDVDKNLVGIKLPKLEVLEIHVVSGIGAYQVMDIRLPKQKLPALKELVVAGVGINFKADVVDKHPHIASLASTDGTPQDLELINTLPPRLLPKTITRLPFSLQITFPNCSEYLLTARHLAGHTPQHHPDSIFAQMLPPFVPLGPIPFPVHRVEVSMPNPARPPADRAATILLASGHGGPALTLRATALSFPHGANPLDDAAGRRDVLCDALYAVRHFFRPGCFPSEYGARGVPVTHLVLRASFNELPPPVDPAADLWVVSTESGPFPRGLWEALGEMPEKWRKLSKVQIDNGTLESLRDGFGEEMVHELERYNRLAHQRLATVELSIVQASIPDTTKIFQKGTRLWKAKAKCDECKVVFKNILACEQHARVKGHRHIPAFFCPFQDCAKVFSAIQHRQQHLQDKHDGKVPPPSAPSTPGPSNQAAKPSVCTKCAKTFATAEALQEHYNNTPLIHAHCRVCDMGFESLTAMLSVPAPSFGCCCCCGNGASESGSGSCSCGSPESDSQSENIERVLRSCSTGHSTETGYTAEDKHTTPAFDAGPTVVGLYTCRGRASPSSGPDLNDYVAAYADEVAPLHPPQIPRAPSSHASQLRDVPRTHAPPSRVHARAAPRAPVYASSSSSGPAPASTPEWLASSSPMAGRSPPSHSGHRKGRMNGDVDRPDLSYRCRVCQRTPCAGPVATMCGHMFCHRCLMDEIAKSGACPQCGKQFFIQLHLEG